MEQYLKSIIKDTFDISNDKRESNYFHELYLNYREGNTDLKCFIVRILMDIPTNLKKFHINKWCIVMHKILSLSSTDSKLIEEIVDIVIFKSNVSYSATELLCRKLVLLFILDYLSRNVDSIKIDFDIMSKLIFIVCELLEEQLVGIVASSVMSQCIQKMNLADFQLIAAPIVINVLERHLTQQNFISTCPHLFPIILSLTEPHKAMLTTETDVLRTIKIKECIVNFLNVFQHLNKTNQTFYFHCFAQSELFETFWHCFLERFFNNDSQIFFHCLSDSLCITDQKVVDIVWSNAQIWRLLLSQLTNDGAQFHCACKNIVTTLTTKDEHRQANIIGTVFEYFLTKVDRKHLLLESKIPQRFRLSLALIPYIEDKTKIERYLDELNTHHNTSKLSEVEKVFIIEQLSFICLHCADNALEKRIVANLITFQTRELSMNRVLSDTVKRVVFTSLMRCLNHTVARTDMSLHQYLLFLKSLLELCVSNMSGSSMKMLKSLLAYIDEQMNNEKNITKVTTEIFPCFGAVICYLSFFLLSRTNLKQPDASKDHSTQIIEWIKDCFKAVRQSLADNCATDIGKAGRSRMLSISSLCSEEKSCAKSDVVKVNWTIKLLDILLKIYDEDKYVMNEAVKNIVSVMIRTKTIDMTDIRYLKNFLFSDKACKKKINEFEMLTKSQEIVSELESGKKLDLRLRDFKERCTNILATVVLQSNDVNLVASCLFIMLDICSSDNKFLTIEIETVVKTFQEKAVSECGTLNSDGVAIAINSILALSGGVSSYEGFVNMANGMIIGLLNRTAVNEFSVKSIKPIIAAALFENGSDLQKEILQNVFVVNLEIISMLRELLLDCVQNARSHKLAKFNAFYIIRSVLKHRLTLKYSENFVSLIIDACERELSSINLDISNSKYATVLFECLTESLKFNRKKLSASLLTKIENFIAQKSENKLVRPILKFYEIYNAKASLLKNMTLESIIECDDRLTFLLKLLPTEFNKDMDVVDSKELKNKKNKEVKTLSKFSLMKKTAETARERENTNKLEKKLTEVSNKRKSVSDETVNKKKTKLDLSVNEESSKQHINEGKHKNPNVETTTVQVSSVEMKDDKKDKKKKKKAKKDTVADVLPTEVSSEKNQPINEQKHKKKAKAALVATNVTQMSLVEMKDVQKDKKKKKNKKEKKDAVADAIPSKVNSENNQPINEQKHKKKAKQTLVDTNNVVISSVGMKDVQKDKKKKKSKTEEKDATDMTTNEKSIKMMTDVKVSSEKSIDKKKKRNKERKAKRNAEMNAMEVD